MEGTSRPDVIVDVDFEAGLLFLAVRNIGDRPALDVTTTFNRKLLGLGGGTDVSALPLFGTSPFSRRTRSPDAPRHRGVLVRAPPGDEDHRRVAYRDAEGKDYRGSMSHDLEIYREIAYVKGD